MVSNAARWLELRLLQCWKMASVPVSCQTEMIDHEIGHVSIVDSLAARFATSSTSKCANSDRTYKVTWILFRLGVRIPELASACTELETSNSNISLGHH